MKKNLICLLLICTVFSNSAFCQDQLPELLTKKGKTILPVEGQFAIGFDASPIFAFAGNIMNLGQYNTLSMELLDNQLYGKYLINNNLAARLKMAVNNGSGSLKNMVRSDLISDLEVEDSYTFNNWMINLSPGMEFRRGNSRMQVIYGAEFAITFSSQKEEYSYGNQYSSTNTHPRSTLNFYSGSTGYMTERVVSQVSGKSFGIGARAFTGLEYFIFPKISIGTEIGLSYSFLKLGGSSQTNEFWNYTDGRKDTETESDNGGSQSGFSTDVLNGQIVLMFYL